MILSFINYLITHSWVNPAVAVMQGLLRSWRWAVLLGVPSTPPQGKVPGRLPQRCQPSCNSLHGTRQWAGPLGPSCYGRSSGGCHNLSDCRKTQKQTVRERTTRWYLRHASATGQVTFTLTQMSSFLSEGTSSCVIHALSTQRMLALISKGSVQAQPQTQHTYELTHSTTMFFHRFLVLIILTMQVLWGFLCSSCSSSGRKYETHTLRPFLSEGNERPATRALRSQCAVGSLDRHRTSFCPLSSCVCLLGEAETMNQTQREGKRYKWSAHLLNNFSSHQLREKVFSNFC